MIIRIFSQNKTLHVIKKQNKSVCKELLNLLLSYTLCRAGFPKVGQAAPLGAMTDTQGATGKKVLGVF